MGQRRTTTGMSGFTIVELLIVIVVIGILAALVIGSFARSQKQALNSQTVDAATKYYKGLLLYATENHAYPSENGNACLGETTDYPNGCWSGGINQSFNDALRPYMGSAMPNANPNNECLSMYGGCRRGGAYNYVTGLVVDGKANPWTITYVIRDVDVCRGPAQAGGTWTSPSATPNASGYIEQTSGTRLCRLLLPDPRSL